MIGAGMGGLSAAVALASAGLCVTLVEAGPGPGGKMRTLPSPAGPVDAGPTVLTMKPVFEALFDLAGARIEEHLRLIPQPVLARHWWADGSTLDLHADPRATVEAIAAFAGLREAAAFRRFHASSAAAFAAFAQTVIHAARPRPGRIALAALQRPAAWPLLLPGLSLARALSLGFADPRLRQLFGRYATYVGGSPFAAPAVLALIWQAEAQGVWAVEGGMNRLARALTALAAQRDVGMIWNSTVVRIVRQGGRVAGVVLADGRRLPASQVVFNGDPAALRRGLLGDAPRGILPARATDPRSLSARVLTFAAEARGLPLIHHNLLFADDARAEFSALSCGMPPRDATLYLCAQDRAGGARTGPERFQIILNAPPGVAENPEEDERCHRQIVQRLDRFGLRLTPVPGPDAMTAPSDFARLFPGSGGAIYGRSPESLLATFLRPTARTALPGLYLAGGGVHPGAGVPMATLSGMRAAEAILDDLALRSRSGRTAMPGGMSTGSRTTGAAPSR